MWSLFVNGSLSKGNGLQIDEDLGLAVVDCRAVQIFITFDKSASHSNDLRLFANGVLSDCVRGLAWTSITDIISVPARSSSA